MRPEPRRARPYARLDALLTLGALGVSLVSALALAARGAWAAELLAHFRLQYLAVQLVLLGALAVRRRRRLAALVLAFALVNAAAVSDYWPGAGEAAAADGPGIKLLTANLYAGNRDYDRFVALARRENPDVLVLLEVDDGWSEALGALAAEYPERVSAPRGDAFGIELLSRLPLAESRVDDLRGAPIVDATLVIAPRRELRLIGAHLRPPSTAALASERNAQLAALGELVAAEAGPSIVTGDLNLTPYSPWLADWLERTGLRDVRRGRGFAVTWPTFLPILGIPIDHCLVSAHFIVAEQYQGPAFGSDHYPVVTRLYLRGNE